MLLASLTNGMPRPSSSLRRLKAVPSPTTPGSSTSQTTAFAVVCCGRNDRVGEMRRGVVQTRTPTWLDRPEALNMILIAFVMTNAPRKVPLSSAFGE
jgi:hypothetical protein